MNRRPGTGQEFRALLRREPRLKNMLASLAVLLSGRTPALGGWVRFFDPHPMRLWRPRRGRTLVTSVLVHFCVGFLIIQIPWAALMGTQPHLSLPLITPDYQLIYPLPPRKLEIHSPPRSSAHGRETAAKVAPSHGAERAAGAGLKQPAPTPQFMLVLKPPNADNREQTIIQAGAPPDLRIRHNVPLPNVLISGIATEDDPKMPTTASAPKAAANPTAGAAAMNIPVPVIPDMALAVQIPTAKTPLLASPEVALPLPASQQSLGAIYATTRQGSASKSSRGLLVLGANPAPPGSEMRLPPGNRYGSFSVSLLGDKAGVPSGPGGPAMGGGGSASSGSANAPGKGSGNGSAPAGIAAGGGNGASSVAAYGRSSNGAGNAEGILPPWRVASLVYPVARKPDIPAINLIVTAGPIGGGGLGAFGVLDCSTIYTIYLDMPVKPWVLQYCLKQASPAQDAPAASAAGVSAHFGGGVAPPWPTDKFDFHRPPVASYLRDKMIVIRGFITATGAVKDLKLYQGVGSLADAAALSAFGRWKFHPASGPDGKPTQVEILVGIPAVEGP